VSWLEELKPGDLVAIPISYSRGRHMVERVDRVTATQIIVGHRKYRKSDGRPIPYDGWSSVSLCKATPEIVADAQADVDRKVLEKISGGRIPCDNATLREMVRIHRAAIAKATE